MGGFLTYTVIGIFTGAAYAIAASGLVLTYSTTRVFNIAHGAVGMLFAYVYWDFSVRQGVPVWLSLILVLGVVAPAIGVFFQRFVTRGLGSAPVAVTLVVTVAMLVGLIGVAQQIWDDDELRAIPAFYPDADQITIGSVNLTWQQIITVVVSILVAIGLWVLLARTRVGTAMRASVDNPDLLGLYGGRANVVSALAWAIGTSLGALSGILLAPSLGGLDYYTLTLLVISAYAAAMLGKLTNLPMTYVGALALGLAQSYAVGYMPTGGIYTGLRAVIPTLFLFAILVLLPQVPLRIGQIKGIVSPPVPTLGKSGLWGGVLVLFVVFLGLGMADSDLILVGTAATYGILMLSLVLLSGYGGFVSLAQFAFAGVGAVAYCKVDQPNLFGLVVAMVVAGLVGALVALPVLRLTGLYLALATLAFGQLMDKVVFTSKWAFEFNNPLNAEKLSILGFSFEDYGRYVPLMAVMFVLVGLVIVAVRRGRLGRILIAMRDSQAACGTLGLDMRWFRVGVFAGSASIAGLAGALLAGLRGTVVANDFLFFNSLVLLLMAGVWGVTSVTGAMLGGVFMMLLPEMKSRYPGAAGAMFMILAVGAILLAKNPNGLANYIFKIPGLIQGTLYPALAEKYPGLALRVREYGFGPREEYDEYDEPVDQEQQEEVDADVVASR